MNLLNLQKTIKIIDLFLISALVLLLILILADSVEFLNDPLTYSSVYRIERVDGWISNYFFHNYIISATLNLGVIIFISIKYFTKNKKLYFFSKILTYIVLAYFLFGLIYNLMYPYDH